MIGIFFNMVMPLAFNGQTRPHGQAVPAGFARFEE
ncbi:hypothetical protein FBY04_12771 [Pseudomonas sp. SJZ080]|nr:hypothetical protein FBY04_12771 [Pseudomonas sp. SJZ080]